MDYVTPGEINFERIRLYEFKRIIRLWIDVDSYDVESGSMVSGSRSTGTAEEIQ